MAAKRRKETQENPEGKGEEKEPLWTAARRNTERGHKEWGWTSRTLGALLRTSERRYSLYVLMAAKRRKETQENPEGKGEEKEPLWTAARRNTERGNWRREAGGRTKGQYKSGQTLDNAERKSATK
ncbi:hypothetical protein NDU88_009270 [Pleurodeles waltl]|uniref:Uncharacterized protein n=1 Tax=Pleurodeles waltl TaxID=8319 RepID=A0AAV7P1P0_PLEWA|nr:hypothetical protein NDU88_009270 [Pleurodeles waltl]